MMQQTTMEIVTRELDVVSEASYPPSMAVNASRVTANNGIGSGYCSQDVFDCPSSASTSILQ